MLSKDLIVTVTNEAEGITLTLKTVSALGSGKVSIMADPGVYDIKELEEALKAVNDFTKGSVILIPTSKPYAYLDAYQTPTISE